MAEWIALAPSRLSTIVNIRRLYRLTRRRNERLGDARHALIARRAPTVGVGQYVPF